MNKTIIALLSGTIIGILIAPCEGAISRARIKYSFDRLADILSDWKEKVAAEAEAINAWAAETEHNGGMSVTA